MSMLEADFIKKIKYTLDQSLEGIDLNVLQQLNSSRREALSLHQRTLSTANASATGTFKLHSSIAGVKVQLDTTSQDIDPDVSTRLDAIRQLAVAAHHEQSASKQSGLQSLAKGLADIPVPSFVSVFTSVFTSLFTFLFTSVFTFLFTSVFTSKTFVPASAIAASVALVALVSLVYTSLENTDTLVSNNELSLLASADDFEIYENLDFYLWLAENADTEGEI